MPQNRDSKQALKQRINVSRSTTVQKVRCISRQWLGVCPFKDFPIRTTSGAMFRGQKIVVVMPAFNASRTLRRTYDEGRERGGVVPFIVGAPPSRDDTAAIARTLPGVKVHVHAAN